jgi:hypothetical protein
MEPKSTKQALADPARLAAIYTEFEAQKEQHLASFFSTS